MTLSLPLPGHPSAWSVPPAALWLVKAYPDWKWRASLEANPRSAAGPADRRHTCR